jgi:hypothetical protein
MNVAALCYWCAFSIIIYLIVEVRCQASTTLTSNYASSGNTNFAVTFNLQNTNSYPILVTQITIKGATASASSSITLFYRTTPISATSTISVAGGWTSITTQTLTSGASSFFTIPVSSFEVPASITYAFAFTTVTVKFNTPNNVASIATIAGGGVNLLVGGSTSKGIFYIDIYT